MKIALGIKIVKQIKMKKVQHEKHISEIRSSCWKKGNSKQTQDRNGCMYIPGDSVSDLIDGLLIGQLQVNNMETGKLTPCLRHWNPPLPSAPVMMFNFRENFYSFDFITVWILQS